MVHKLAWGLGVQLSGAMMGDRGEEMLLLEGDQNWSAWPQSKMRVAFVTGQ